LGSYADGANLGDRQKEFLVLRVSEIQKKLEIVRKALEELSRLSQGDMAALKEREDEITAAYEEAQDRALDAMSMLLMDGPMEILSKRREAMKKAIDNDLTKTLLVKNVTLKAEDIARLDQKGFVLVRMKNGYTRLYDRTEGLQKTLSGAKSLSDMSGWADSEINDYEKLKEGTLQIVEMMLADEKVGGKLKLWKLTGASALRLLSLYKATDAAWEFFYDIMKQKFVWGPLVDELNKSLETNRRAVIELQEKSRDLQTRLNCLRNAQ
jgi:chaperonin cofactor prefoldin